MHLEIAEGEMKEGMVVVVESVCGRGAAVAAVSSVVCPQEDRCFLQELLVVHIQRDSLIHNLPSDSHLQITALEKLEKDIQESKEKAGYCLFLLSTPQTMRKQPQQRWCGQIVSDCRVH